MADYFADIIASGHNQHAVIMFNGKTGVGKSNSALDFAERTSISLSQKMGGKPKDYFTIENVAIITNPEIIRVMKGIKQYNVYIFDDIGVGWSSREWNKKGNKIMNNIVQTFRTKNNILILTLPETFIIDKIPRNLMHYQVQLVMSVFDVGFTIGKLKKVNGSDPKYWPYVRYKNTKFNRSIFTRASDELVKEYELRRTKIQDEMQQESIRELEQLNASTDDNNKPMTKEDMLFDTWVSLKEAGYTLREIGKMTHSNYSYISTVLKKNNITC